MAQGTRKARYARRRKQRMARVEHDLTDRQWSALVTAWGGCAYCGASGTDAALQRDCVLAISRGGRYTVDNVVPACRSCNASKCNAEVTTWMRRKRLDERAFLERFARVLATMRDSADEPTPATPTAPFRPPLPRPALPTTTGADDGC